MKLAESLSDDESAQPVSLVDDRLKDMKIEFSTSCRWHLLCVYTISYIHRLHRNTVTYYIVLYYMAYHKLL